MKIFIVAKQFLSYFVSLLGLILYVPVNKSQFRHVGLNQGTKQRMKCLDQGHNTVPPVRLEPATP